MPMKVVVASANPDKVAEIADILGTSVELMARPHFVPEVVEDGATLEDNARLKAIAIVEATDLPSVADDTGLEVDALGGAPGVHSARFAGDHATYRDNVDRLLRELAAQPHAGPFVARFRTVALLRFPDGRELVAEGVIEGTIATAPRGDHGFGYDPVFVPAGQTKTFAEMTATEKNEISHRGRAFRALADLLRDEKS